MKLYNVTVLVLLGAVLVQNFLIIKNQKKIMAKQDELNALVGRLDAATTKIADELKALRDNIVAGTVSDESMVALDNAIDKLEAMGKDEDNPLPNE